MSSRAKAKQARRERRGKLEVVDPAGQSPLSVAIAAGGLAAFVALRGVDLQEKWGTNLFVPTVASELVPILFLVGLLRSQRWAYLVTRWGSLLLAIAIIGASFFGYPYPTTRLYALAAALALTAAMLSTESARQHFAGTK